MNRCQNTIWLRDTWGYKDGFFRSDTNLGTEKSEEEDRREKLEFLMETVTILFNGGKKIYVSDYAVGENVVKELTIDACLFDIGRPFWGRPRDRKPGHLSPVRSARGGEDKAGQPG